VQSRILDVAAQMRRREKIQEWVRGALKAIQEVQDIAAAERMNQNMQPTRDWVMVTQNDAKHNLIRTFSGSFTIQLFAASTVFNKHKIDKEALFF
jgi:hypothetical protein